MFLKIHKLLLAFSSVLNSSRSVDITEWTYYLDDTKLCGASGFGQVSVQSPSFLSCAFLCTNLAQPRFFFENGLCEIVRIRTSSLCFREYPKSVHNMIYCRGQVAYCVAYEEKINGLMIAEAARADCLSFQSGPDGEILILSRLFNLRPISQDSPSVVHYQLRNSPCQPSTCMYNIKARFLPADNGNSTAGLCLEQYPSNDPRKVILQPRFSPKTVHDCQTHLTARKCTLIFDLKFGPCKETENIFRLRKCYPRGIELHFTPTEREQNRKDQAIFCKQFRT